MFMAIPDLLQMVDASLSDIRAGLGASPEELFRMQMSYLIAEVIMIQLAEVLAG